MNTAPTKHNQSVCLLWAQSNHSLPWGWSVGGFFSDVLSLSSLLIWRGAGHLISVYLWLGNRFLDTETTLYPTRWWKLLLLFRNLSLTDYGIIEIIMECISNHSVIDSNQQSFPTVLVLLNLDISQNICNGLLLQQDINNNSLGSYTQQSLAL